MAKIIHRHYDSHNVCRKAELFIIWYALNGEHIDTGACILHPIVKVVKTTYNNVIGFREVVIAIAKGLHLHRGFSTPEAYL